MKKKIGEILVENDKVSASELENAILHQITSNVYQYLGEILVDFGYVAQKPLKSYLKKQKKLSSGNMVL